jgi:hypothetical protein
VTDKLNLMKTCFRDVLVYRNGRCKPFDH